MSAKDPAGARAAAKQKPAPRPFEFIGPSVKISKKMLAGRRPFPIPVRGLAARLGAAAYLAWLAYPGEAEAARRRAFVEAWRALIVKAAVRQGFPRVKVLRRLRGQTLKEINRKIRHGVTRIVFYRWPAAVMAEFVMIGAPITQAVRLKIAKGGRLRFDARANASNVFARVWRPSLPVIHLALALREVCKARGARFDAAELVRRPDWLPGAIDDAERFRILLLTIPKFGAENFIRLRAQ